MLPTVTQDLAMLVLNQGMAIQDFVEKNTPRLNEKLDVAGKYRHPGAELVAPDWMTAPQPVKASDESRAHATDKIKLDFVKQPLSDHIIR